MTWIDPPPEKRTPAWIIALTVCACLFAVGVIYWGTAPEPKVEPNSGRLVRDITIKFANERGDKAKTKWVCREEP